MDHAEDINEAFVRLNEQRRRGTITPQTYDEEVTALLKRHRKVPQDWQRQPDEERGR